MSLYVGVFISLRLPPRSMGPARAADSVRVIDGRPSPACDPRIARGGDLWPCAAAMLRWAPSNRLEVDPKATPEQVVVVCGSRMPIAYARQDFSLKVGCIRCFFRLWLCVGPRAQFRASALTLHGLHTGRDHNVVRRLQSWTQQCSLFPAC